MRAARVTRGYLLPRIPLFCIALVIVFVLNNAGHAEEKPIQLTFQEQLVVKALEDGKWADLEFEGVHGELRGEFLEKLLANEIKDMRVHRNGIRIRGAEILGSLNLRNVDLHYEIRLENCVFRSSVTFDLARFRGPLSLKGSTFYDAVSFRSAQVSIFFDARETRFLSKDEKVDFYRFNVIGDAFFNDAIFSGPTTFALGELVSFMGENMQFVNSIATADFGGMQATGDVYMTNARFWGPVNFSHAKVMGGLYASKAQFLDRIKGPNFNSITVTGDCFLENTLFEGGVVFRYADIGNISATSIHFANGSAEADFNSLKVRHNVEFKRAIISSSLDFSVVQIDEDVSFDDATFDGSTDFSWGTIRGTFDARGAKFSSHDSWASFDNLKVGNGFRLSGGKSHSVFLRPVSFRGTQIEGDFIAHHVEFKEKKKGIRITGSKIKGSVNFADAVFEGPVVFIHDDVEGDLTADRTAFTNPDVSVSLNDIKVGSAAFFNDAHFDGSVNFGWVTVGNNLEMDGARFTNSHTPTDLGTITVQGVTFFRNVEAAVRLSIRDAQLEYLTIGRFKGLDQQSATEKSGEPRIIKELDLRGTVVRRDLKIQNLELGALWANPLRVGESAQLTNLKVADYANLENAHFLNLVLREVRWPQKRESVRLDGIEFKHIGFVREPDQRQDPESASEDSWRPLVDWLNGSFFASQPYQQLETAFRDEGHPDRADEVFVEMKLQERKHGGLGWFGLCKNFTLRWLVNYGRDPEWAFGWSLIPLVLGTILFGRKRMERAEDKDELFQPYFNRFWFSLDLLTPFIDLSLAKKWEPRSEWRFGRNYAMLHRVSGWILIPIGLAALTGIIK